jgi:hypothetical protein
MGGLVWKEERSSAMNPISRAVLSRILEEQNVK